MPANRSATTRTTDAGLARASRRRARTRAAILDAAQPVFRRDGYQGARIEEIAAAADVSVGSIYSHFDNKRNLYLHLVDRALGLFTDYMARSEDPAWSPLQRVLAGGDAYLQFHLRHPDIFGFLANPNPSDGNASSAGDAEIEGRLRDQTGRLLRRFADQIDTAIAAGEACPVDSMRLTHYLWGAWNGVIALRHQPDGLRLSDDEITETLELGRWLLREALSTVPTGSNDGRRAERVPMPKIELPPPP